jgi:hypothetical protein
VPSLRGRGGGGAPAPPPAQGTAEGAPIVGKGEPSLQHVH